MKRIVFKQDPFKDLAREFQQAGIRGGGILCTAPDSVVFSGNFSETDVAKIESMLRKRMPDGKMEIEDSEVLEQQIKKLNERISKMADGPEKDDQKNDREYLKKRVAELTHG